MIIRPLYFTLCLLLLAACGKEEEVAPEQPELPSCLEERATVQVIQDEEGILEDEAGLLLIKVISSNETLAPCNLPDIFRKDDRVIFSGNKKEILPNERRAGQPFELTSIEKQGA